MSTELSIIEHALLDAQKAVRVLLTMLTKEKLKGGVMVADEILGSISEALKQVAPIVDEQAKDGFIAGLEEAARIVGNLPAHHFDDYGKGPRMRRTTTGHAFDAIHRAIASAKGDE